MNTSIINKYCIICALGLYRTIKKQILVQKTLIVSYNENYHKILFDKFTLFNLKYLIY